MDYRVGMSFTPLLVIFSLLLITITFVAAEADEVNDTKEYKVLGKKLNLDYRIANKLDTVDWTENTKIWRILFPIKIGEYWNGFYGYLDIEVKKDGLHGPININGKRESPFSAEDFCVAMKKAEDKSLILVIDLDSYYRDGESRKLFNMAVNGSDGGGENEDIGMITKGILHKFEGKYATIIPSKTRAGWEGGIFTIEVTLEGDIPVKPKDEFKLYDSFVLIGSKDMKFELTKENAKAIAEAESELEKAIDYLESIEADKAFEASSAIMELAIDSVSNAKENLNNAYESAAIISDLEFDDMTKPIKYSIDKSKFKREEFKGLIESEINDREMITCLKIAPGDPIYAPGYIVSYTTLFEGNIASVVNTEFSATIYFDTNLTDEYLERILSDGDEPTVKIIKGEENYEDKNDESKDKDNVSVAGRGLVKDEKREAQAFVVIDRQLREGDKIKIILHDEEEKEKIDMPIINDTVKEVKGTPFKDERIFSAQIMTENSEGMTNARAKIDYKNYRSFRTGRFVGGRIRWHAAADISNGDTSSEDYLKGRCELQFIRFLSRTSEGLAYKLYVGAAGSGSYFPEGDANFHEYGGTVAGEFGLSRGNLEEPKNVLRLRISPTFAFGFTRQKGPQGDTYNTDKFFRGSFPGDFSYNFNGFGFKGEAILSIIRSGERTELGLPTSWPFYFGFTVTFDPKIVEGFPFGLDAQSPVALNFTFEEGRKPPKFEEIDSRLSFGFEYAPVIK